MATIQEIIANRRKLFALPLLSSLAMNGFVSFAAVAEEVSPPSTLVNFFVVPLSGISIPPILILYFKF
jgi:hypothetical protein